MGRRHYSVSDYSEVHLMLFKANSFTLKLLNHLLSEIGLFTLHNCCASCSLGYYKSKLEFKSRLPIPEFFGYQCIP